MKRLLAIAIVPLLVAGCGSIQVADSAPEPSLAQRWGKALNECNLDTLVGLYHSEALFWPTTSPSLATKAADVRRYYEGACNWAKTADPRYEILSENVMLYGDTVVSAGQVKTTFKNPKGDTQTGLIRFTLTGRRMGGTWAIIEHHSSLMPSPPPR